jgi:uncharacterized protein
VSHLRFAGASAPVQDRALREIISGSALLMSALEEARAMDLPDWWLVSGAIYQTVWNALIGRPATHGLKDIDLFYFDPDTSWEAEDRVIKAARFPGPVPVEIRNQARVPLWYPAHFGQPYPPIGESRQAIDLFACRTHCVGLRLGQELDLYAPYGLDDIFAFRLTPNTRLRNRVTHDAKAARQMALWPELTLVPWPPEG